MPPSEHEILNRPFRLSPESLYNTAKFLAKAVADIRRQSPDPSKPLRKQGLKPSLLRQSTVEGMDLEDVREIVTVSLDLKNWKRRSVHSAVHLFCGMPVVEPNEEGAILISTTTISLDKRTKRPSHMILIGIDARLSWREISTMEVAQVFAHELVHVYDDVQPDMSGADDEGFGGAMDTGDNWEEYVNTAVEVRAFMGEIMFEMIHRHLHGADVSPPVFFDRSLTINALGRYRHLTQRNLDWLHREMEKLFRFLKVL